MTATFAGDYDPSSYDPNGPRNSVTYVTYDGSIPMSDVVLDFRRSDPKVEEMDELIQAPWWLAFLLLFTRRLRWRTLGR